MPSFPATLRALEEALLDPTVRRDRKRLAALLADDFFEFGSSGHRYSRADVIEGLTTGSPRLFKMSEFTATRLALGCALVTYRVIERGRSSLRSSTWVKGKDGWRLAFHQGTKQPSSKLVQ